MEEQKPASPVEDARKRPPVGTMTKILVIGAFFVVPSLFMFVTGFGRFDAFRAAKDAGSRLENPDPAVPPFCFAGAEDLGDTCTSCHGRTPAGAPGRVAASRRFRQTHPWFGLEDDLGDPADRITEGEARAWVGTENLAALQNLLRGDAPGPELDGDFDAAVDAAGFLEDGSGWRALRRRPFPGLSWPSLVGPDQIWMRLPAALRTGADGRFDPDIARVNHELVRANVLLRELEGPLALLTALDERALEHDLDGDGALSASVDRVRSLPATWAGTDIARVDGQHPIGTQYLQLLAYPELDPPFGPARRLREARYLEKEATPSATDIAAAEKARLDRRAERREMQPEGSPTEGVLTSRGWRIFGFIEDRAGRLRARTLEETASCVGCHSALPALDDGIFTLDRQLHGAAAYGRQEEAPEGPNSARIEAAREITTWLEKARSGDPFAAWAARDARLFENGTLAPDIRRALSGGRTAPVTALDAERALELVRLHRVLVDRQKPSDFLWPHRDPIDLRPADTPR